VLEAVDGVQGLEIFRQQPEAIACVILDLSMPNMGGIEVFRAMRLIRPDVRILLTSGYSSDQSTSAQLAGEGLAGFIQKPFTAQTLLHELERALKRP
jgi:CheY-like chemotaxis protein